MFTHRLKTSIAIAGLLSIAIVAAACSSSGSGQTVAAVTQAPAVTPAPATQAAPASQAAAGGGTVLAKTISGQTVLVAGSNGMTVYTYTKDTAGSGQSTCTGGCLAKWPALTVPAGSSATAGDGVTGALATITRADDGTLQVTYNGLPLYFYVGDKAPGDLTGSYPNWNLVKP